MHIDLYCKVCKYSLAAVKKGCFGVQVILFLLFAFFLSLSLSLSLSLCCSLSVILVVVGIVIKMIVELFSFFACFSIESGKTQNSINSTRVLIYLMLLLTAFWCCCCSFIVIVIVNNGMNENF